MIRPVILDQQEQIVFKDRADAGRKLSKVLEKYKSDSPIVLALPRGGVVVGYEVAKALDIPLDVLIVRKIGAPHNPELAIGAISEGNIQVFDDNTLRVLGIQEKDIENTMRREKQEIQRRIELYRDNLPLTSLSSRTAILVDDGLATGMTAQAAIKAALQLRPHRLVFAAPVCAYETGKIIKKYVDDFICLLCPPELYAIGKYYQNFTQTTDKEVLSLLNSIVALSMYKNR